MVAQTAALLPNLTTKCSCRIHRASVVVFADDASSNGEVLSVQLRKSYVNLSIGRERMN